MLKHQKTTECLMFPLRRFSSAGIADPLFQFDQHLAGRLVVRRVVQLADRPQQAPRDEIEIAVVADRGIVMAEGRGEDFRLFNVLIGPDADGIVSDVPPVFVLIHLLSVPQRLSRFQQLAGKVVIELFILRLPAFKPMQDWVFVAHVRDFNWSLRPMSGAGQAREIEPQRALRIPFRPIAMNPAVEHDGRQPFAVRPENFLHGLDVLDVGTTFVMHNDIKTFGPVLLFVPRVEMLRAGVGVVPNRPLDIDAGRDPLREERLLFLVVMTTATEDEERADRLSLFGQRGWTTGGNGQEQADTQTDDSRDGLGWHGNSKFQGRGAVNYAGFKLPSPVCLSAHTELPLTKFSIRDPPLVRVIIPLAIWGAETLKEHLNDVGAAVSRPKNSLNTHFDFSNGGSMGSTLTPNCPTHQHASRIRPKCKRKKN